MTAFIVEAIRTINASWWEFNCARLFGTKSVEQCLHIDRTCTIHTWRGKRYLTDAVSGLEQAQASRK